MSWSSNYEYKWDSENQKPSFEPVHQGVDNNSPIEVAEQHDKLLLAAYDLLISGVVGDHTKNYKIGVHGHANPNHEPAPGWANDAVTITITQV